MRGVAGTVRRCTRVDDRVVGLEATKGTSLRKGVRQPPRAGLGFACVCRVCTYIATPRATPRAAKSTSAQQRRGPDPAVEDLSRSRIKRARPSPEAPNGSAQNSRSVHDCEVHEGL